MPKGVYPHLVGSLAERFLAKVDDGDESGCWLWTGATGANGYGKIQCGRRGEGYEWAHRVSWELFVGPIPEGQQVLHRCDNPACVRPEHLFLGTRFDNMRDAAAKGRCRTQKDKVNREAMRAYLREQANPHEAHVDPCGPDCRVALPA